MFLLILEDLTPVLKEAITLDEIKACDFGYLDIYEIIENGNSVQRYIDGLWENVEPT